MSADRDRLADYLGHIVDAIERIDRYTTGMNEADFLANALVQDAAIRNLEIVGEASHNIAVRYPAFAAEHPELPLAFAYQMRNVVAHGYFQVDLGVVWQTIRGDLPELLKRTRLAIGAVRGDGGAAGKDYDGVR